MPVVSFTVRWIIEGGATEAGTFSRIRVRITNYISHLYQ